MNADVNCYVYCCLVSPIDTLSYLKVGYSCQPYLRARQLKSASNCTVTLLDIWDCKDVQSAKIAEHDAHERIDSYRHDQGFWKRESFRKGSYRELQEFMLNGCFQRVYKNQDIVIES